VHNIHAHVWDPSLQFAAHTIEDTNLSRGYPVDLTVRFESFMSDMAPFDRVVVFGMKARLSGYWVPDQYVADFVNQAPDKLVGFAACDPTQDDCLWELRYGIETLRLAGVKMGPIYAGIDPRDNRCDPVYRYCVANGLPILFHTGTTFHSSAPLSVSRPWLFDEVATRYPGLRIVLAHVGHPWCEECLVVIRKHPHVYADISALYYRPWQFYNMLIAAQEYQVTQKLLFGTDYPFALARESLEGLRNVNAIVEGSALPRVSADLIEGIIERDACGLLGIPRGAGSPAPPVPTAGSCSCGTPAAKGAAR
jgi:predicted TIM-barrel fold metal-dependent hydrolase